MTTRPTRDEDGEPQPTWFKYPDRKPSGFDDRLLVALKNGCVEIGYFYFDPDDDGHRILGRPVERWEVNDDVAEVTHWMPLPDHPRVHNHTATECSGPCPYHLPSPGRGRPGGAYR